MLSKDINKKNENMWIYIYIGNSHSSFNEWVFQSILGSIFDFYVLWSLAQDT